MSDRLDGKTPNQILGLIETLEEIGRRGCRCAEECADDPAMLCRSCEANAALALYRDSLSLRKEIHEEPRGDLPRHVVRGPCWCIEGNHGG